MRKDEQNELTAPTSLLSSPMPNATVATTLHEQKTKSQQLKNNQSKSREDIWYNLLPL